MQNILIENTLMKWLFLLTNVRKSNSNKYFIIGVPALRFKELITEITAGHRVEKMWVGQYGLPTQKRIEHGQQIIGEWNSQYNIWVVDHSKRMTSGIGESSETEIEVTSKLIPHPFVGEFRNQFGRSSDLPDGYQDLPQEEFDELLQRKYHGPQEFRIMTLTLQERMMFTEQQKVKGHTVSWVQKVPEGIGSEINMQDFYIWLMHTFNTAIISDSTQSKGGASIWKKLAKDPRVDMFGYSPEGKGKFSQVDAEGDADLWDTWTRDDQEIVDQANSARKSAWGTIEIDKAVWQVHKDWNEGKISKEEAKQKEAEMRQQEMDIRQAANDSRDETEYTRRNQIFIVPSNRSMHS